MALLWYRMYLQEDVVVRRKQAESSLDADGKDNDTFFVEEPDFLPLDDVLQESDKVNLVEKGIGYEAARQPYVPAVNGFCCCAVGNMGSAASVVYCY